MPQIYGSALSGELLQRGSEEFRLDKAENNGCLTPAQDDNASWREKTGDKLQFFRRME